MVKIRQHSSPRIESKLEVNTIHYNVVISACHRGSLWSLSLELVTGVSGLSSFALDPSIVSFNSVMNNKSWSFALQLLRHSRDRQLQATAVSYNSAAKTMGPMGPGPMEPMASRHWPCAIELLDAMHSNQISSDQVSLTAVMAACDPSQWQTVLLLIEPRSDVISFTTAINTCGAAQQWQMALQLLSQMSNDKVLPNQFSFGAAISACEKASEWTWALHLLEFAERTLEPNEILLSAVISACEKSSHWDRALSLLQSLQRRLLETTSESYNPAISACSSGSQWQLASKLFEDMPLIRLKPDSFTYTAMMRAFAQGCEWQSALLFLENVGHWKDLEDETETSRFSAEILWNGAINACAKGSQWQMSLSLFDTKLPFSEASFGAAISACAQGSNWQVAIKLLHDLHMGRWPPSLISYSAAIAACGAEWQRALDLLEKMISDELLPNVITYNSMISACEKGLQWQLALSIFDQQIYVDSILYSAVISACGTASEWLMALQLVHRSDGDTQAVAAAITACERGCQWQFALELLQLLKASNNQTSSMANRN